MATITKHKLVPELRFPEFEGVWKKLKLEEVSDRIQDGTHFSPKLLEKGNYKYITSRNIRNGYMELIDVPYLSDEDHKGIYKRCDVQLNDILLTKDGSATGTVCMNTLDEEFSLLSSVAFIRGNEALALNDFIYQCIAGPIGQREILASIAGQAITRITLTKLRNFKFSYPSLPEQEKIAAFLSAVDEKIQQLTQKKELLEEYKKGVMQQLFSGKLRFKDENGKNYPDWEEKKLNTLCLINKGKQLNKNLLTETGEFPSISGGINPSGYTNKWNKEPNTIIISEGGNSCGYTNYIKVHFWCGGHCYAIDKIIDGVQKMFLFKALKYNEPQIMRLRVGSGLPNIQKKDISNFKVNLPCLEEQEKIATLLSGVDTKIESVANQIAHTQAFKKGLLQKMFV